MDPPAKPTLLLSPTLGKQDLYGPVRNPCRTRPASRHGLGECM